eukprot:3626217-Pleurochrysis_carterae.AAC.1
MSPTLLGDVLGISLPPPGLRPSAARERLLHALLTQLRIACTRHIPDEAHHLRSRTKFHAPPPTARQ